MKVVILLLALISFAFGQQVPNSTQRIVGGQIAARGEFPWIVSLQINGRHGCGGTILNEYWIVTAAHCAVAPATQIVIVAGEYYQGVYEGMEQGRRVSAIIRHPAYNRNAFSNDIALMRVSYPFKFGPYVSAVNLPTFGMDVSGNLVAAGWGANYDRGQSSPILQKVTVPVVPMENCAAMYAGMNQIQPGMICSGSPGRDVCQGDSGGPLLSGNTLVGVVSWGARCGSAGHPGVYSSVPFYVNWISQYINQYYWF